MSERNITEAERTLGYLLRLPYERLSARVYGGLAARGFADIRPAHSPVFRYIVGSGSRVSDLADQAGMTKQSMAYLVQSLATGGYVRIWPDPSDGRARLVRLTRRGQAVSEALLQLSREAERELATRLSAGRVAELRGLLEDIAERLGEG